MFDSDALFELEPQTPVTAGFAELARLPLAELVAPDWADALAPVEAQLREVLQFLAAEVEAGYEVLPAPSHVLRAFRQPLAGVRVLIVGQDPYPTPGHAVGLSFAVDGGTRPIPRSLANIYKELEADLALPPRVHGDLSRWAEQGVLLLNRVNRTTPAGGQAPLVVILWGKDAGSAGPLLGSSAVIASAHPSPLSASRGFFGSRPFSRANALLQDQGNGTVDWELPPLP
jgi:uracil-DNA glycosylase